MAKDRDFPSEKSNTQASGVIGLASPNDRLAAYIVDVTLLLPLLQLIQAPFKRWIVESFLFDDGSGASVYRFINLAIFVLVFTFYYTVMTYWKGQTFGKMFFRIKVISYHGRLSLLDCLTRSFVIFFEFLLFGLPFFAMFSHSLRRPIHDRVADTLVISLQKPVSFPSSQELVRSRVYAVSLVFLLLTIFSVYLVMEPVNKDFDVFSVKSCAEQADSVDGSLEAMVELFLVSDISEDCLQVQARKHLWEGNDSALASFAMALALNQHQEKSDQYLLAVCKENKESHLCDFSQWLAQNSKKKDPDLGPLLDLVQRPRVENFVKILIASHVRQSGSSQEFENIIKTLSTSPQLEPAVAAFAFHSLLSSLKWEEAMWLYRTHSSLGEQDVVRFLAFQLNKNIMGREEQIQLIRFFFPDIGERPARRGLASEHENHKEITEIYDLLVEEL